MQWLNRIPIWAWALITLVLVFATWNPSGYSMYHYVIYSDAPHSSRFLLSISILALYAFYLHETFLTFNKVGALIFVLVVAAVVWKAVDWGLMDVGSITLWQWIAPMIFALLLLIGLQGNRIYRNLTGRVPVSVDHHAHDGHVPDHHAEEKHQ